MLRVTKLADYGIVMLTHFALHRESSFTAPDIAGTVRLPLPVVSKILKLLGKAGLLTSQRGTKGGYRLAVPAERITIATIICALEGPIAVTGCTDVDRGCTLETRCPVSGNWHLINQAIYSALERITLAQMATPLSRSLVALTLPGAASSDESMKEKVST